MDKQSIYSFICFFLYVLEKQVSILFMPQVKQVFWEVLNTTVPMAEICTEQ